ncbi:MAG: hypothetical protein ACRDLV_07975, partial [Solirubrobacteraceae bacterium]
MAVSDAWRSAKISRFERVTVQPDVALLRLTGNAASDALENAPRPALVIDSDHGSSRFQPLPGPPDGQGVLRVAYSVPAAAIAGAPRFSLQLADGSRVELPDPVPGPSRAKDAATESRLLTAMAEIDAQAEARIAQVHAGAEARVSEAQSYAAAQIEQATAAADARVTEAEARAVAAEARAAEAERREQEIAAEIERRVNDGRAQARAEADARAAEAAAPLRERLAEAEEAARRHEAGANALSLEVESLRDARTRRERELRDALDSVRKMAFERDELSRQVEAFDQVATKARERASQAEAENERSAATLDELQTWRGELERRLAATTSELGAARMRLREDERDMNEMRAELTDAEARAQASGLPRTTGPGAAGHEPVETGALSDAERARLMERIMQLEAAQRELAHRATRLAAALAPAERLTELAQSVADALQEAERLRVATVEDAGLAPSVGNGSPAPGASSAQLEEIGRRALTDAADSAEHELSQA